MKPMDDCDDDSSIGSDSDYTFTEFDESLVEMEERLHEYAVVGKTPALAAMLFDKHNMKSPGKRAKKQSHHLDGWASCEDFDFDVAGESDVFAMRKSVSDVCIQSMMHNPQNASKSTSEADTSMKPDQYLKTLLQEEGMSPETFKATSIDGFFVEFKPRDFADYDNDIARAVREGNLEVLMRHTLNGRSVVCCNKFKESILHTICRRGHKDMMEFLLASTDASIQVRDEQGRTPLHDAAWTHEPNFELVKLLLGRCPRLLLVEDNRGFTPLNYVGKQCWGEWCNFLKSHKDLLPTEGFQEQAN
eukprot:CAMPEP_0117031654 /NCGR_PEP_ID=MMETSP0472-20121206/22728_1 /TAXON_ID=693140 ORGANISM="Tiarina fusus, Strain LIS" /NCGR_SAMPLE_ID=MMETSP0472 /ASSEMBLY_ACC=CAM_ASM_000603 /LENGTH=302 /DNA_ID=CAMNT_0004740027 /DNA_START=248 /DNA_END=1156 /DNA_ORIENTATION=+